MPTQQVADSHIIKWPKRERESYNCVHSLLLLLLLLASSSSLSSFLSKSPLFSPSISCYLHQQRTIPMTSIHQREGERRRPRSMLLLFGDLTQIRHKRSGTREKGWKRPQWRIGVLRSIRTALSRRRWGGRMGRRGREAMRCNSRPLFLGTIIVAGLVGGGAPIDAILSRFMPI